MGTSCPPDRGANRRSELYWPNIPDRHWKLRRRQADSTGTGLRRDCSLNRLDTLQAVFGKFCSDGNRALIDIEAFGSKLGGKSNCLRILDFRRLDVLEFQRRWDQIVERGRIGIDVKVVVDRNRYDDCLSVRD